MHMLHLGGTSQGPRAQEDSTRLCVLDLSGISLSLKQTSFEDTEMFNIFPSQDFGPIIQTQTARAQFPPPGIHFPQFST